MAKITKMQVHRLVGPGGMPYKAHGDINKLAHAMALSLMACIDKKRSLTMLEENYNAAPRPR